MEVAAQHRLRYVALLAPLGWGFLSYLVFSLLGPNLPVAGTGSVPKWIWLWLLQMSLALPFWVWMAKLGLEKEQRQRIGMPGFTIPLGKPVYYLAIAYLAALSAMPFHDRWYGQWLVFGGIVSPIFEELFSRNLLTPWLKRNWGAYLAAAAISSAAFALMHWGFNNLEAFSFTLEQQAQKFVAHFLFALVLCVIYRFTKSVQLLIWLHIAMNLKFLLTKL